MRNFVPKAIMVFGTCKTPKNIQLEIVSMDVTLLFKPRNIAVSEDHLKTSVFFGVCQKMLIFLNNYYIQNSRQGLHNPKSHRQKSSRHLQPYNLG